MERQAKDSQLARGDCSKAHDDFFYFTEVVFPCREFISKIGAALVQHTFIRKPDDDVILKSDSPVSDAQIPTVAPSTRHTGGDRIVEIKALPSPDGQLLLSFLHASGKHHLQPVRSLEVLIHQLAAQTANPPPQSPKTKDLAGFPKGTAEAGAPKY